MTLGHIDDVVHFVQPLMVGFPARWCLAGGWAIDVFVGHATRPHADVELAIFRPDQSLLHHHLRGWAFDKVVSHQMQPWSETEHLDLPVHEIHAHSKDQPPRAIEFLLNERNGNNWVFRRNTSITLSLDRAILHSASGLPTLSPEIVLLYKAKSPRPKDENDFRSANEIMNARQKHWLRSGLAICHPSHPWIGLLGTSPAPSHSQPSL